MVTVGLNPKALVYEWLIWNIIESDQENIFFLNHAYVFGVYVSQSKPAKYFQVRCVDHIF